MNTHDTIRSKALLLFSQKGYADASVRDICKQVGIKESSLYFHYRSKQKILDVLTEDFIRNYSAALNEFADAVRRVSYPTPELFRKMIERYLKNCFLEEDLRRFFCIMLHEQGQNSALRTVFEKWLYDEPLELMKEMFMIFIESGFIRRVPVSFLAESFYAPIVASCLRYLSCESPDTNAFLTTCATYLDKFLKEYRGA